MNDVAVMNKTLMTVKEVAGVLLCHIDTVHNWIDKLYPDIKQNGKTTYLNEEQVTRIKQAMDQNYSLRNAPKVTADGLASTGKVINTDLEMLEKARDFMEWAAVKIKTIEAENITMKPKAEIYDRIANGEGSKLLSEVGKINGIGPRKIFELLSDHGIIFRRNGAWEAKKDLVERDLFRMKDRIAYTDDCGMDHVAKQLYVTPKGELWITKHMFTSESGKTQIDAAAFAGAGNEAHK